MPGWRRTLYEGIEPSSYGQNSDCTVGIVQKTLVFYLNDESSVSKIPTAEISQVKVMGKFHLKTFTVFCRLESCTKIQRGLAISLLPPNNLLNHHTLLPSLDNDDVAIALPQQTLLPESDVCGLLIPLHSRPFTDSL